MKSLNFFLNTNHVVRNLVTGCFVLALLGMQKPSTSLSICVSGSSISSSIEPSAAIQAWIKILEPHVEEVIAAKQNYIRPEAAVKGPEWPTAHIAGGTVFYPFGGADIYTPLTVVSGMDRIINVQLSEFGNLHYAIRKLNEAPTSSHIFPSQGASNQIYSGMLGSSTLISFETALGGLGALTCLELLSMGGEILSIDYLEWIENRWIAHPFHSEYAGNTKNGKITFRYQNRIIEYWMIQMNLQDVYDLSDYPIYDKTKITRASAFNPNLLKAAIVVDHPSVSILKAIHQAADLLQKEYKNLGHTLESSEIIYSDPTVKNEDELPNHVLKLQERNTPLFGTGDLRVWIRKDLEPLWDLF